MQRCPWVPKNDTEYEQYHDTEWGRPVHNDRVLFEFMVLESAQAGLSWKTVLSKRKGYKKAFANFNPEKVAQFTQKDVDRLMALPVSDIVRHRGKIEAAIGNAQCFLEIQKEFGSFDAYVWQFVDYAPIRHTIKTIKDYPIKTKESIALANDLKNRGCKFFGATIAYAYMQAIGMVNDHAEGCFLFKKQSRISFRAENSEF